MARRVRPLHGALMAWYARARRDLPWRRTTDPYAIWLSEVMLQQTRVDTVVPYYARFLATFPTVHALAEAPLDAVLSLWSGLGYYRRARMLHDAAREVLRERGGVFPDTAEGLGEIRGIGRYTAGAIASIAFGESAPLVDGNVARVLARLFAIEDDVRSARGLTALWELATWLVPAKDAGAWNQALMELGATICTPRSPACPVCPARDLCDARARGLAEVLPRVKKKAEAKVVRRVALVATRGDRVVLARRAGDGLFGGMWEPPQVDVASDPPGPRLEALIGQRLSRIVPSGSVVHVLTHRRMKIDVVRAKLLRSELGGAAGEYDAFELVRAEDMASRGLPTLARKVLAAALESTAGLLRSLVNT